MQKTVAVIGLGKSGLSAVRYFLNKGYKIFVWDDNPVSTVSLPKDKNIISSNYQSWDWKNISEILFSPGISILLPKPHPVAELARKYNVKIISDIEVLAQDKSPGSKIIAITGTNGKSTTTALIYHILKENNIPTQIGGNYGIPALDLNIHEKCWYIIEISSFQLDITPSAKFDIAIFLNITPDHMERYATLEKYAKSKMRIFNFQEKQDSAIICIDTPVMERLSDKLNSEQTIIKYRTGEYLKNFEFHNLPGEHNLQNITAAYLACKQIGLSDDAIIQAIFTFEGLDHRMQKVAEITGIKFINDSKATNADATEPALKTFENIYWMAGGVPKEGGIETLKKYFSKISQAYFYGQAKEEFAKTYSQAGFKNYTILNSFKEAFDTASENAFKDIKNNHKNSLTSPQKVVLLSPACASFDEFKNYEERGKLFKDLSLEFVKAKNAVG